MTALHEVSVWQWHGMARYAAVLRDGAACCGLLRCGIRNGTVRYAAVCCGTVWHAEVCFAAIYGTVRYEIRYDTVCCGMLRYDIRCGMLRWYGRLRYAAVFCDTIYGTLGCGMLQYGVVYCGMPRYDILYGLLRYAVVRCTI
ncbi:unnamed protein product [Laminaria digitata]